MLWEWFQSLFLNLRLWSDSCHQSTPAVAWESAAQNGVFWSEHWLCPPSTPRPEVACPDGGWLLLWGNTHSQTACASCPNGWSADPRPLQRESLGYSRCFFSSNFLLVGVAQDQQPNQQPNVHGPCGCSLRLLQDQCKQPVWLHP